MNDVAIPKSLSKDKTIEIFMDVSDRGLNIIKTKLMHEITESDVIPTILDTLANDLVYMDYGYQENIFR